MTAEDVENTGKVPQKRPVGVIAALVVATLASGVGLYAARSSAGRQPDGTPVTEAATSRDAEYGVVADGAVVWPFKGEPGALRLKLPPPARSLRVKAYSQEVPLGALHAMPYQFETRVFERAVSHPRPLGIVRRGTGLYAVERVYGPGCTGGWYTLTTGGLACTTDGFHVSAEPPQSDVPQPAPRLSTALPFRYAKLRRGALRFYRPPDAREEARIADYVARRETGFEAGVDPGFPEVVEEELNGAYFVALDDSAPDGGWLRTVRGRYVRQEDAELRELPPMHGEVLGERWQLPLGFVHGDEPVPLLRAGERVGLADKHGRFPVRGVDDLVVTGPGGISVPRDRVRIARAVAPPEAVPRGARWIHVNLSEQTLVAYEGARPVFATLVSSGLEEPEFATPEGLYRVREKHVSVTMNGPDPDAGRYEVEEVPWTQYYHDSYALHGAYWHDNFGRVRSHGCTNLAPMDARWLFHWTDPELPAGWHARRRAEGTHVWFTR